MGSVLHEAVAWYNLPLTVLLGVVVLYWVMVIVGVLSADSLDFDVDAVDADLHVDGDFDLDAHADVDVDADAGVDAGLHHDVDTHHDIDAGDSSGGLGFAVLRFLNFGQVPAMVVISALVVSLWFFSMVANFVFNKTGDLLLATVFFAVNVLVSMVVAKIASAPLVPLFRALNRNYDTHEPIVGRECVILSATVDSEFGRAEIEREGAPIQLRVHIAPGREPLKKGDRALVVDHDEEKDIFLIKQIN